MKLKKSAILIPLFLLIFSNIFSQINQNSNLSIIKNKKIKRIFDTYNKVQYKKIDVFTIQLHHNESRSAVWKSKNRYEKQFPNKKTNLFYEAPYFKVTTEYFLKKILAQEKMDYIKDDFPDCFIIKKSIPLKEF